MPALASHLKRMTRSSAAAASLGLAALLMAGCSTTVTDPNRGNASAATSKAQIDSGADATLSKLYATSPQSRELVSKARAALIFPSVIKGGFMVGAEYGKGVLRVGNRADSYYSVAGGSFGFQAGAQSSAVVLLFMTEEALTKFRNSNGWTVGADATVAVANVGANGTIDTNTIRQPIVAFVLNNAGLMAGVSIEGSKVTRLMNP